MTISKSNYIAGLQCLKRLYWQVHEPEGAAQPDASAEAIMEPGHEVGMLASEMFPVEGVGERKATWPFHSDNWKIGCKCLILGSERRPAEKHHEPPAFTRFFLECRKVCFVKELIDSYVLVR
jgi:hypothetical protein